jgi:AlwI restriction endonuclease.
MPHSINHWWSTRPKRKLITIVDVLRVFLAVAEGKKWSANRELHREFENALEANGLKGEGERRDGQAGGARTYGAWLLSFGLWFEDSSGLVRSTFAGDDLVKGKPPVPIMTEQLFNYQHPSPFSRKTRVDPRFRLFPFRFILRLLLHPKLNGLLSKNEIALFVITNAESEKDLNAVAGLVTSFRASGENESSFDEQFTKKYGSLTNLRDTANTLINQLDYTQLIGRTEGEDKIFILDSKRSDVEDRLKSGTTLISRVDGEFEFFQRKYGLGPHHSRDDRKFKSFTNISASQSERSKVLIALSDVLARQPIRSIGISVLNKIAERTGVETNRVEEIISSLGVQPSYDIFEERYLQLAVSGRAFATAFEQATEGIFGVEGLGLHTEWIGSHPNGPDVLAISTQSMVEYLGILDSKAYTAYSISGNNRRVMTDVYLPKFQKHLHEGKEYDLAFFAYVAGGFKSTINGGIRKIFESTSVCGSAITATDLIMLLNVHRKIPISAPQLKQLFSINRQILPRDFSD